MSRVKKTFRRGTVLLKKEDGEWIVKMTTNSVDKCFQEHIFPHFLNGYEHIITMSASELINFEMDDLRTKDGEMVDEGYHSVEGLRVDMIVTKGNIFKAKSESYFIFVLDQDLE